MTMRGDHVFLASDRDRNRKSGFGVYLSRVVNGEAQPPEKVDLYIEEGDPNNQPATPANSSEDLFEPSESASKLATMPTESPAPAERSIDSPADATEVATGNVTTALPTSDVHPSEILPEQSSETVPQPNLDSGLPPSPLPQTALVAPDAPLLGSHPR
jgi:hypothetical protein